MTESNHRIGIQVSVDSSETKEFTKIINILDRFNKQSSQVVNALNQMSGAMDRSNKAIKSQTDQYVNLERANNAWMNRLRANESIMKSQENSQSKLTEKLKQYGRDVKVTVDETGKLSASFKNVEGNLISLSAKYDNTTNSIKNMKTTLSTVSNEVQKKAEADKRAAQEMDRLHQAALKMNRELDTQKKRYQELTRGTDLSRVLKANGGAFDVMNNAIERNSTIVRASIDRNGKFSQTLRQQDGTLKSISGYYDSVNKKLVQYNESMTRAEGSTRRLASQQPGINSLSNSMHGLHEHTQSFAEAVQMGVNHILLFKVAGSIVLGLQRGFKSLLDTMFQLDDQMTQLTRVMPETTNFNEMMEDSIRLSTELGRTLTDINAALITFAKAGFNNIDTRYLSEAATLMSNVSDIDVGSAAETLTSAITLFNIKARDSIQVVNKLNEVNISASLYSNVV